MLRGDWNVADDADTMGEVGTDDEAVIIGDAGADDDRFIPSGISFNDVTDVICGSGDPAAAGMTCVGRAGELALVN